MHTERWSESSTPPEAVTAEVDDYEFTSLESARRAIRELRSKCRNQAQQLTWWRRAYLAQEERAARAQYIRKEQLARVSCRLLQLQAGLARRQRDIEQLLTEHEKVQIRQQQIIERLLAEGSTNCINDIRDVEERRRALELATARLVASAAATTPDPLGNDSDSAVVLEDDPLPTPPMCRGTVARSVSDAMVPRGFLRRPEVLETVYSVEEVEQDSGTTQVNEEKKEEQEQPAPPPSPAAVQRRDAFARCGGGTRLPLPSEPEQPPPTAQYNRVMSNHRSVTKPKDVKYKRINKAKSKSLEELRGRLRGWAEQSALSTPPDNLAPPSEPRTPPTLHLALTHSHSCA